MSKFDYTGPEEYRPISAWGYVGYSLLFSLPLVGLILLIVFAFNDDNYNRRSYARSYFCWMLIAAVISIAVVVLATTTAIFQYGGIGLERFWR